MTWLIAGLGNPGPKYAANRHNIGFLVVDEFARQVGLGAWRANKLGAESTTGTIANTRVVLIKPQEYMNLSGFAVSRALDFHRIEPASLVVAHDEIDLEFGIVRIKQGGGHGGHNGLRSIIGQLGTPDFARLRVGVGRDPNSPPGAKDAASWVLADFSQTQRSALADIVSACCENLESILRDGVSAAMNRHNGRPALATPR